MNRKQPVLLLLVVGLFAAWLLYNFQLQVEDIRGAAREEILRRETRMSRFLQDLKNTGDQGHFDLIHKEVEDLRVGEVIDFYILKDREAILWWGGTNLELKTVDRPYPVLSKPQFTKEMTSVSIPFDDGLVLTIGIMKDVEKRVQQRWEWTQRYIIEEASIVFLIILFVSMWRLRDIRAIFAKIKKGDLRSLSQINARSQESELFVRGLSGFAQSVDNLQHANELLNKQILPSLKKEIFSGKKPPYDFNCTLARVDINNFSTIYNTHDVTAFMQVINEFFVEVSHVVTRYGGLIHEFVGDEVIIYFKDEDHPHSFLIALSAIRDVNAVATEFNIRTSRDFGYPFTVKSSLAHGRVRFGPLVNGYTVAGSVLIETVRILANIHEKDGNVVFFDKSHAEKLKDVVTWREAQTVKLKGFSDERVLCAYMAHRSLEDLLAHLEMSNVDQLDYFRSDEHVNRVIRWLKANADELPERVLLEALMHLRRANITKTSQDFGRFILTWCEELTKVTGAHEDLRRMTIASSVVKLMIALVPKESFHPSFADRLKLMIESKDRRVVANVLEVLTYFDVKEDKKIVASLRNESDSRISANALVHSGREEITKAVLKSLTRMLESKDVEVVASGLYALGEIAQYHRKRDYVYFSTQIVLKELLESLPTYLDVDDPSVRRQACLAAVKAGEDEIIAEMVTHVRRSPTLSIELRDLLPPLEDAA